MTPADPVAPVGPVGPVAPAVPALPEAPVGPVAPVAPLLPVAPVAPVGPVTLAPVGPVAPVAPAAPVAPVVPAAPVAPVAPAAPVDPVDPVEPAAPVAPVGPAGPVGPVAPAAPAVGAHLVPSNTSASLSVGAVLSTGVFCKPTTVMVPSGAKEMSPLTETFKVLFFRASAVPALIGCGSPPPLSVRPTKCPDWIGDRMPRTLLVGFIVRSAVQRPKSLACHSSAACPSAFADSPG